MNRQCTTLHDRKIARSLFAARRGLRHLLVPESESLISVLGHVEAALEYSAQPGKRALVTRHCKRAAGIVAAIRRRHSGGLPEPVSAYFDEICRNVDQALRQADTAPAYEASRSPSWEIEA